MKAFLAAAKKSKATPYVIGAVGLFLVVLIAYIVGKSKKKDSYAPAHVPLPSGGSGIPIVGTNSSGQIIPWDPNPLAKELWGVLDGVFTTESTKEKSLAKLNALTNDQLVAVYNAWNDRYYKENDETLTEMIANEIIIGDEGAAAIATLRRLNLSFGGDMPEIGYNTYVADGSTSNGNWGFNTFLYEGNVPEVKEAASWQSQEGTRASYKLISDILANVNSNSYSGDSYDNSEVMEVKQLAHAIDMENVLRSQDLKRYIMDRMGTLGLN